MRRVLESSMVFTKLLFLSRHLNYISLADRWSMLLKDANKMWIEVVNANSVLGSYRTSHTILYILSLFICWLSSRP